MARHKLSKYYDDKFYDYNVKRAYQSARRCLVHLYEIYEFKSIIDIGCGRGAWLKAALELGARVAVGCDGPWNEGKLVDSRIEFRAHDLSQPFYSNRRYDLAISLEVAEHLSRNNAVIFVENLVNLSDIIVFGAAYTRQGGTNHVNEQPPSYWGRIFRQLDYKAIDFFRPVIWGDSEIEACYRQNTFLYVKNNAQLPQTLHATLEEIPNYAFMDCMHPDIYLKRSVRLALSDLAYAFMQRIAKALGRP